MPHPTLTLLPQLVLAFLASTCVAASQPNILFLLSDDQDWTGLSFRQDPEVPGSSNPFFETPNLAALAEQGMRFTDAYAPASVCSATRMSLQTGMSTARTGWTKAGPVIRPTANPKLLPPSTLRDFDSERFTTLGELLKKAGYLTAHYGKWHIRGGGPEANGYHESDGDNGNEVAFREEMKGDPNPVDITGMGERAAAFMSRARAEGKPFYIQMSYHALHAPEHARESTIAKYEAKAAANGVRAARGAALTEDLDRGVGDLLRRLAELGLAETTYVLYMSDNGAGGGGGKRGRILRGGKGSIWEGGIRSPLIVRGPGVPAGSVSRTRVTGLDLLPTFCTWAGIGKAELPAGIDGGDLSHVLTGSPKPVSRAREEIVFHFPHYQGDTPQSALYLGDHKLVRSYETDTVHLYDIGRDLAEAHDLAPAQPELAEELHGLLRNYLAEVGAKTPAPNPNYDPDKPTLTQKAGKGGKRRR